ncbi:TPA: hypothetical protein ACU6GO_005782 [Pseudomonas aeruginosa]|uniref:hypothetical protein n=1 Tax=Pseudomonas aeruginosa TaxID=287 RepID=UPI000FC40A58|nr:hypothetical protein [Pseudomonas aeruginosa]RUI13610.1 hypothetical protein IPC443_31235 [Pseudomonas aeruginosa]HBO4520308.1 hypothetical protein [Pseudomonas aeruginosa]HBO6310310.1 hypothetical protein [Pseudomonas aeruginosa]
MEILSCRHLSTILRFVYPNGDQTCEIEQAQIHEGGQLLRSENIRCARFVCGYLNEEDVPFVFDSKVERVSPIELLKLVSTYHKNLCDTPGYFSSPAYELLSRIRQAAIEELPGYKEALERL